MTKLLLEKMPTWSLKITQLDIAEKGHEAILQQLLTMGRADADTKDKYGRMPL